MKKILLIVLLLILVGCESDIPTDTKPQDEKSFLNRQEIICVKGVKIWIGETEYYGYTRSVTSQIIGECDLNE